MLLNCESTAAQFFLRLFSKRTFFVVHFLITKYIKMNEILKKFPHLHPLLHTIMSKNFQATLSITQEALENIH